MPNAHDEVSNSRPELMNRRASITDVLPREPPKTLKGIHMLEMPAHATRDSMLTWGSGYSNYRGLYNLAIIILFAFGSRLVLENIRKYGLLISPTSTFQALRTSSAQLGLAMLPLLNVYIVIALLIEKAAASRYFGPQIARIFHWLNIMACLILANVIILKIHPPPLVSFVVLFETVIVWMKLISYIAVNEHYRLKYIHSKEVRVEVSSTLSRTEIEPSSRKRGVTKRKEDIKSVRQQQQDQFGEDKPSSLTERCKYPLNLTFANMYYYLLAPTLCYELYFPRSNRIRYRFLMRRCFEAFFLLSLIVAISQQWIMPTVENTFKNDVHPSLEKLIDRTLKLSVPNNIIWLAMFYFYFHSLLNIFGEILRFGDRQFYRDWWNSTSISYFWKNWNIPVHKWAVRHMYRPLVHMGFSRMQAQVVVFLFSAVMHEVLFSVPLGLC
eukprot:gene9553-1782_t